MNKEYKILSVLAICMAGAVVYALVQSGSPGKTRGLKYDADRINNLYQVNTSIQSYYSNNNKLPQTLSQLTDSYLIAQTKDPETGADFEYNSTGQTNYTLCATFAYSSDEAKKSQGNTYNSMFIMPPTYGSADFTHPAGHYCFPLKVMDMYKRNPLPSPYSNPSPVILSSPYVNPSPTPLANKTNYQYFINKVLQDGTIDIIVGLNVNYVSEGQLTQEQIKTQRAAIFEVRNQLVTQLQKYSVSINSDSENWITPYLVLSTEKKGLDFLTKSPLVKSIEENKGLTPSYP
jgi:hypothetical protein